jgi:hypothetical protein
MCVRCAFKSTGKSGRLPPNKKITKYGQEAGNTAQEKRRQKAGRRRSCTSGVYTTKAIRSASQKVGQVTSYKSAGTLVVSCLSKNSAGPLRIFNRKGKWKVTSPGSEQNSRKHQARTKESRPIFTLQESVFMSSWLQATQSSRYQPGIE